MSLIKISFKVNKDVYWTLINKFFLFFRAPFSIFFIVIFLSPIEQGLWYTFGSLAAIKILIELGFTEITTQYISHYVAGLKFQNGTIVGEQSRVKQLFDFIYFSFLFYLFLVPFSIMVLSLVGYYYFEEDLGYVMLPWFFYIVINSFNLFLSFFQSVYLGMDKVKEIQKNIFFVNIAQFLSSLIFLALGFGLFSLPFSGLFSLFFGFYLLFRISKPFWLQLLNNRPLAYKNYFPEILPFQFKFILSSISSYLSGFLLIPAANKFLGAIVAGQFGITLSVFSILTSLPIALITSKMPRFGIMVANDNKKEVFNLFKTSFVKGIYIFFISSIFLLFLFLLLDLFFSSYSFRFLSIGHVIFLIVPSFVNFILSSYTYFFRAFKKEAFVSIWLLQAFLIALGLFFFLPCGLMYFLIYQNLISVFILLPIIITISKNKFNKYL